MADSTKIVTRFAPSPTGFLHIGGARTALFNWAFARRHGGVFILRIEDTDKARSTRQATHSILQDLQWLGIDWDQGPDLQAEDVYDIASQKGERGPYFQSQRDHLYKAWLDKLRDMGRAYDDAEGGGAVRFRMPESDITVHDLVLGDVTIKRENLEDFIIMKGEKSGGGPTFHFANVVDDATMGVTHVLRAQEHLMNTPKHVAMFDALGLARPKYAHMPLIFNADGSKMSKRDKAKVARQAALAKVKEVGEEAFIETVLAHPRLWCPTGESQMDPFDANLIKGFLNKRNDDVRMVVVIEDALRVSLPEIDVHDFRWSGYLTETIVNYISLLGWSPEGKDEAGGERFGLDDLARNFTVEGIGKANARFDRQKLLAFNAQTIQSMPIDQLVEHVRPLLSRHQLFQRRFEKSILPDAFKLFVSAYQQRMKTLDDPFIAGAFLIQSPDEITYDPKAVEKVLRKNDNAGHKTLVELKELLVAHEDWSPPALHQLIEQYVTRTGRGMGDVAQPLRVAVTGNTVSPPIHDTLALLGKASTLARIECCLAL